MKQLQSKLAEFDLRNRRVFLRCDLNVPLDNGTILDDYRLTALLPTLAMIKKKGGTIILATHLGRPEQQTSELSTQQLMPWFIERGFDIFFEPDLEKAMNLSTSGIPDIILLENLRFFPGEREHDFSFAQQLAHGADFYVNDAFALLHRHDTSITVLPDLFAKDKKTIGLLVEQELRALSRLRHNPSSPFVVILGGGKVHDKLPLLRSLIGKADTILLCPAASFTFLKAQGKEVGLSLVDEDSLSAVTGLLRDSKAKGTRFVLPVDYQVALESRQGTLKNVDADAMPANAMGMNIGIQTQALFAQEIMRAATVFFNGVAGFEQRPQTLEGSHALLRAMVESSAFTVIGGGDTVAAARRFGVADRISYCSTGGGATLAYLAGEQLPGLTALQD